MHMFQRREDWIQFVAAITCKTFKHKACSIVVVGHPFHQKYMFQLPSYWESLFFWQIVFWCKHARLRHLWENMFHIKKLFVVSAPAQLCCCFNLGEEDLQAQLPFKKKNERLKFLSNLSDFLSTHIFQAVSLFIEIFLVSLVFFPKPTISCHWLPYIAQHIITALTDILRIQVTLPYSKELTQFYHFSFSLLLI